jgi:tRNA G18 (ribose-2'-O)-methylase SpoU
MIIIAHDIRSLHNIGSIFRNAAAFGIEKVYLTGFTATPPRKEIAKVALGAEDLVPWEAGIIEQVITGLKAGGYAVYGLETGTGAIDIAQASPSSHGGARGGPKLALVLGNEVEGIDKHTLELLDGKLMIPMHKKQSLNVSVASGVAMYVLSARS